MHEGVAARHKELVGIGAVLLGDMDHARLELRNGRDVLGQNDHGARVRGDEHALDGLVVEERRLRRRQAAGKADMSIDQKSFASFFSFFFFCLRFFRPCRPSAGTVDSAGRP